MKIGIQEQTDLHLALKSPLVLSTLVFCFCSHFLISSTLPLQQLHYCKFQLLSSYLLSYLNKFNNNTTTTTTTTTTPEVAAATKNP
jgi:uncharacterized membrane protein YjjB (DUF3815 family)